MFSLNTITHLSIIFKDVRSIRQVAGSNNSTGKKAGCKATPGFKHCNYKRSFVFNSLIAVKISIPDRNSINLLLQKKQDLCKYYVKQIGKTSCSPSSSKIDIVSPNAP